MTSAIIFSKNHLYFLVSSAVIFLAACNRNNSISSMNPDNVYKNWQLVN